MAPALADLFRSLIAPPPGVGRARFAVADVPGAAYARVGKSVTGQAAMLFTALPGPARQAIRLRNLSVLHAAPCEVISGGNREQAVYTIVTCEETGDLQSYFFLAMSAVLSALGEAPSEADIDDVLASFVQLFRSVEKEPTHSLRGLWGELLVIANSKSVPSVFAAWHQVPNERWDFGGGAQRVEVKTCGRDVRKHHFSLDQLDTSSLTVVVASMQVESGPGGVSVLELVEEISGQLGNSASAVRLVSAVGAALGMNWRDFAAKFDRTLATGSLRLYWAQDIPTVPTPLPPEVSAVSFVSDLTLLRSLRAQEITKIGGLIAQSFG